MNHRKRHAAAYDVGLKDDRTGFNRVSAKFDSRLGRYWHGGPRGVMYDAASSGTYAQILHSR